MPFAQEGQAFVIIFLFWGFGLKGDMKLKGVQETSASEEDSSSSHCEVWRVGSLGDLEEGLFGDSSLNLAVLKVESASEEFLFEGERGGSEASSGVRCCGCFDFLELLSDVRLIFLPEVAPNGSIPDGPFEGEEPGIGVDPDEDGEDEMAGSGVPLPLCPLFPILPLLTLKPMGEVPLVAEEPGVG